jgi:hypothetical protein
MSYQEKDENFDDYSWGINFYKRKEDVLTAQGHPANGRIKEED